MEKNNQIFKMSKELYGDTTATYNNIQLTALNKLDLGSSLSFKWGDTSAGSEALSYAILNKVGSREIANRYAKPYTKDLISKIKKETWTLNATAVIQWINENTNYAIDESAYLKNGTLTYEYKERREEDRRKEERRIKREKDFQEEAQRRLKIYEEKGKERQINTKPNSQEELNNYKKRITEQDLEIEAYKIKLNKYRIFVESLDIKEIYKKYSELD